jgi:ribosomal protein S18 acetylase RimI-like enzyme
MIMKVREAMLGDEANLSSFLKEAWKEAGPRAPGFTGATDKTIEEISSIDFLKKLLVDQKTRIFVAEDEDRIVGFASTKEDGNNYVELSGIIVLESKTGLGVGKQLLEAARSSAALLGVSKMIVKTEVFNDRAIWFYKRMGFTEMDRTTEEVEGILVDLLFLSLST